MDSAWDAFWSIAWYFFWGFAFVAYLFAIIGVLADLFRDRKLNGWAKALWLIFLIFLPFLTVLVYVIARGRGMVERLERIEQDRPPAETYAPAPAMANPASEISRAKELLDAGVISAGEFDALKNKALGNKY
jgi:hypothetical protein